MREADRRRMAVNRRKWDESVPLHVAAPSYDVPSFERGALTLRRLETDALSPVSGRSLLHLQCHFGLDTLSWARLGAKVTGVDFSGPAIRAARRLSRETGIPARFVQSNIYDLAKASLGAFDIVYTAKGAICWLPDLTKWARVVAHFLKPGGRFFLLEDHPASDIYDSGPHATELVAQFPYFSGRPQRDVSDGTYAAHDAKMRYRVSYSWVHPISAVLSSLIRAGLQIESVREFPYTYWHKFPFMRRDRSGWWHLTKGDRTIPLMWSATAVRPYSVVRRPTPDG